MRRLLIVTGVLGGGTALTFAAAVLAASLFPNGGTVGGGGWASSGADRGILLPAPAPGIGTNGGWTVVDAGPGTTVTPDAP